LLQGLAFTREGVLRERWITNGETMDAEVFGLLHREWHPPGSSATTSIEAALPQ
jgi:RimJ/RimL family protein N-acetyltransferase